MCIRDSSIALVELVEDLYAQMDDIVAEKDLEISILEADIVAYQQSAASAQQWYNMYQDAQDKINAVLALDKDDYSVTINFGKGGNQIRFLVDGSYIGEAFKWKEKSGDLVETNDDAKNSIIDALEDAYAEGYKDAINDAHDAAG